MKSGKKVIRKRCERKVIRSAHGEEKTIDKSAAVKISVLPFRLTNNSFISAKDYFTAFIKLKGQHLNA